jgi:hypothetical protein
MLFLQDKAFHRHIHTAATAEHLLPSEIMTINNNNHHHSTLYVRPLLACIDCESRWAEIQQAAVLVSRN